MSGGVFPERPFHFNVKCVLFTALVIALYYAVPKRSKTALAALAAGACLALAAYARVYGCSPGPLAYALFVGLVAGLYWVLPPHNLWAILLLLWLPYVGMAYVDWQTGCRDKTQPTALPFGRYLFLPFKPAGYKAAYAALPPSRKAVMDRVDHVAGYTILVAALGSLGSLAAAARG